MYHKPLPSVATTATYSVTLFTVVYCIPNSVSNRVCLVNTPKVRDLTHQKGVKVRRLHDIICPLVYRNFFLLRKKPEEKFEFSLLMHEINVLTNWTTRAIYIWLYPVYKHITHKDCNHILINKLYDIYLYIGIRVNILTWTGNLLCHIQLFYLLNYIHLYYVGVIRTLIGKYQKFMTYRLVYNILIS